MALGDYANSRGAADMGVAARSLARLRVCRQCRQRAKRFERLWGGVIPSKPGLTTPQMVEAAQSGKLKALYVIGANPLTHFGTLGFGRGNLQFAHRSRTVPDRHVAPGRHRFPGGLGLRKRRHRHQHLRRNSATAQSRGSDGHAQRLRSAAHPLAPTRKRSAWAKPFTTRSPARSSTKFARRCKVTTCARGLAHRRRRIDARARRQKRPRALRCSRRPDSLGARHAIHQRHSRPLLHHDGFSAGGRRQAVIDSSSVLSTPKSSSRS